MFKIRHRKRLRLPRSFPRWIRNLVTINTSGLRWTSTTFRLWPFSRNTRRPGRTRIDLPGGFSGEWRSDGRR